MATNPFEERIILEAKLVQLRRIRGTLGRLAHDLPKLASEHQKSINELDEATKLAEELIKHDLLKLGQIIGCKQ